jgi:hypothetical protein
MTRAGPVALIAVAIAAGAGALAGLRAGIVRYRAALLLAGSGALLAPAGIWTAHHAGNRWLTVLFAAVLVQAARKSWHRATGRQTMDARRVPCKVDPDTGRLRWTSRCARSLSASGGVAGLLSGLLGVGGGFVVVPALSRYTDLPARSVVATSLAVVCLVSLHGVSIAAFSGNLDWRSALPFCVGTSAGMLAGQVLARRLPESGIHACFAVLTALTAAAMFANALLRA